jgi:hypothetical protein
MSLDHYSIADLKNLSDHIPSIRGWPERVLADTYEDFIDRLYIDVERIIIKIEENPELRKNDSEDRLTIEIVNSLSHMGYDANHDTKIGGHTDISVRKNNFLWIGEAKKYSGYAYIFKGFLQLFTRYSNSNHEDGALIIYMYKENTLAIIKKWKIYLRRVCQQVFNQNLEVEESKIRKEICFDSIHTHIGSGLKYRITAVALSMWDSKSLI